MVMEWTDRPKFSSSFRVHEKIAWIRFKQFFSDGEGRKRVTKLGCRGRCIWFAFLTSFSANLGQKHIRRSDCPLPRKGSSHYSIGRVDYSQIATLKRRGEAKVGWAGCEGASVRCGCSDIGRRQGVIPLRGR